MKKSPQMQPDVVQAENSQTSTSRLKASKKLAFRSPLQLPLRRGGREKSNVKSSEDLHSTSSAEKRKWKRLPRPSATNLDQIFNGFKSASKKQMTKATKSVPNTPSTASVGSVTRRSSVESIETSRAGSSKSNLDGDDSQSKPSSRATTPQQNCINRFGYRSSVPPSPVVSEEAYKSSEKRYHTLPNRSSTKKIPKRIKAIASVPSTPSFESPGSLLPLETTLAKDAITLDEPIESNITRLASKKVKTNKPLKHCVHTEHPKSTSVVRGRRRAQSTRTPSRDTSVSSATSTSFTNSTSTSSSGPRRHRCDLMGPPYKRTHSRTNSTASPSTSVSSICYSGNSPMSSSKDSLSAAQGRHGVATTPRRRRNSTRKNLTSGKCVRRRPVDVDLTGNCGLSDKRGIKSKPRVASCKSGQCTPLSLCDNLLSTNHFCDKNNNSECKPVTSSRYEDLTFSLGQQEEDSLVLGPIFPTTPIRTRPDGSSDCNWLSTGQSLSPAMASSAGSDSFEPKWTKTGTSGEQDCELKSVDCNESRFIHPEISETVMVPSAFQLPLSSSSVVPQECCQHHCVIVNEDRVDGIGGNSAHTSTCSIASGDFSTGLDTNSVPDLLGDKLKSAKKCLASPGHLTSPSSNSAQNWLRNRSFFLRLIETRRKQHKRDWENKKGQCSSERFSQLGQREGVLQEMADELDEAKSIIKMQETEIDLLRSEISKIREAAIEEECYRVEAEIYRAKAENESRIFKATIVDLQDRLRAEQHKPQDAVDGLPKSDNEPREAEISVTSYQSDESRRQITPDCSQFNQSQASPHCDQGYFSMKRKAAADEMELLAMQLSFTSTEDKSHDITSCLKKNYNAVGCQTDDEEIPSTSGKKPTVISSNAVYHSRRSILQQSAAKLIGAVLPQVLLVSSLAGKSDSDTVEAERLLCQYVIPAWKGMLTGLQ